MKLKLRTKTYKKLPVLLETRSPNSSSAPFTPIFRVICKQKYSSLPRKAQERSSLPPILQKLLSLSTEWSSLSTRASSNKTHTIQGQECPRLLLSLSVPSCLDFFSLLGARLTLHLAEVFSCFCQSESRSRRSGGTWKSLPALHEMGIFERT